MTLSIVDNALITVLFNYFTHKSNFPGVKIVKESVFMASSRHRFPSSLVLTWYFKMSRVGRFKTHGEQRHVTGCVMWTEVTWSAEVQLLYTS